MNERYAIEYDPFIHRIKDVDAAHMVATLVDVIYDLIVAHKGFYNGISSGELYALLMGKVSLEGFYSLMKLVKESTPVEQNGLCWRIK